MKQSSQGEEKKSFQKDLVKIFGAANVSVNHLDRTAYARDLWPRLQIWINGGRIPSPPDCIVWAEEENQISKLLRLAARKGFPVIPYGAGSGVCGGTLTVEGGVILDMKRMRRVVSVDDSSLTVDVETGIIGQDLEEALNAKGYTLGHFPSSIYCSTLGGYLVTRSAGQLSSRYGKIEDMVLGLRVILTSGRVLTIRPVPGSAPGPRFVQGFVGSEGTLGVITRAALRIRPLPESISLRGHLFSSVEEGLTAMRRIMQSGIRPSVLRLYDELDTLLVGTGQGDGLLKKMGGGKKGGGRKGFVSQALKRIERTVFSHPEVVAKILELLPGKCLLIFGFEGVRKLVDAEMGHALKLCSSAGGKDLGEGPGKYWLEHRYSVSYKQSKIFEGGGFVDTIEVATVWSKVERLYTEMRRAVSRHAFIMAHFSHAYPEGCCIYFSFVANAATTDEADRLYRNIWQDALDACLLVGATVCHHHGVGYSKVPWMIRENRETWPVFQALKSALDPGGIMNPGKMEVEGPRKDISSIRIDSVEG
ncbi:FAD-binding oxidoreductase [Thermodesulfobacteriota bacterium]